MKRVVVTGLGVVSPIGNNVESVWDAIRKEKCGIGELTLFDATQFKVKIAAQVKDFDPEQYVSKKEARRMDRFSHFAIAAATMAMEDCGLEADKNIDSERLGVLFGSGIGGMQTIENECQKLFEKGPGRVSPFLVPMIISDIAAGNIAIKYNARGINFSIASACATGNNIIGEAFRILRLGEADAIIAGSSEAPITPLSLAGFSNMTALSHATDPNRASIPFDKERAGFVTGEGSAAFILETLDHALARGAKIYAELVGYGATCDAYHITAPDPNGGGAARAMKLALKSAGIEPSDISYINAHGTGTPQNDLTETLAIKTVFGSDTKVPVSSTKSNTGHLLGAAGSFESVICVKALQCGYIPPTINYRVADDGLDLDYVTEGGREARLEYVLNNSFGFGGHNATLIFKRYE